MEILYQIDNIDKLAVFVPDKNDEKTEIRWINLPDDLYAVYLFSKGRKPDIVFDEN